MKRASRKARLCWPSIRADRRGADCRRTPASLQRQGPSQRARPSGVVGLVILCPLRSGKWCGNQPYRRTTIAHSGGALPGSALRFASGSATRRSRILGATASRDVKLPRSEPQQLGFSPDYLPSCAGSGTLSRFRMGIPSVPCGTKKDSSHPSFGLCRDRICVTGAVLKGTTNGTGHRHWRLEGFSQPIRARGGLRRRLVAPGLAGCGRPGRRAP